MSIKNSNDTIGNRIRNLPTCSALPQPTALPRTPDRKGLSKKERKKEERKTTYIIQSVYEILRVN
jgi:hypothetical protein